MINPSHGVAKGEAGQKRSVQLSCAPKAGTSPVAATSGLVKGLTGPE
jgi:hypothetical protein